MTEKHALELGSVQETLLLCLWGRAVETQKAHPLLVDPPAVSIMESIQYDFSSIARAIPPLGRLAWIARCLHIDRTLREFLIRHPSATVVNLGCGLDTTFERVDNGSVVWYDLDLPDVIRLRQRYIHDSERRKMIVGSILDDSWLEGIRHADPTFFVASGILCYVQEPQVKEFLVKLAGAWPGSEILFDAFSPGSLGRMRQTALNAGMHDGGIPIWGLRCAADLASWDPRISVVAEYPVFRDVKRQLSTTQKLMAFLADTKNIMYMVHLRLGAREAVR